VKFDRVVGGQQRIIDSQARSKGFSLRANRVVVVCCWVSYLLVIFSYRPLVAGSHRAPVPERGCHENLCLKSVVSPPTALGVRQGPTPKDKAGLRETSDDSCLPWLQRGKSAMAKSFTCWILVDSTLICLHSVFDSESLPPARRAMSRSKNATCTICDYRVYFTSSSLALALKVTPVAGSERSLPTSLAPIRRPTNSQRYPATMAHPWLPPVAHLPRSATLPAR